MIKKICEQLNYNNKNSLLFLTLQVLLIFLICVIQVQTIRNNFASPNLWIRPVTPLLSKTLCYTYFQNLRSLLRREKLPFCSVSFLKSVIGHSNDMLFGGRTHRRHVIGMTDDLRYMVFVRPFLHIVKL